ncbi:30S ribosomal protein S3 [Escherichia coli]|uniref:30S ribosomal protein S3 n=1 Tax=Escherichia coli TaxID=562 RepID=A0A3S4KD71_ECOLX|nr:30S ribosomal protein S3 [Escherichia coli]
MFRRAMKRAVQNAMRLGAKGIKVKLAAVWAARKSHVPNGTRRSRTAAHSAC